MISIAQWTWCVSNRRSHQCKEDGRVFCERGTCLHRKILRSGRASVSNQNCLQWRRGPSGGGSVADSAARPPEPGCWKFLLQVNNRALGDKRRPICVGVTWFSQPGPRLSGVCGWGKYAVRGGSSGTGYKRNIVTVEQTVFLTRMHHDVLLTQLYHEVDTCFGQNIFSSSAYNATQRPLYSRRIPLASRRLTVLRPEEGYHLPSSESRQPLG